MASLVNVGGSWGDVVYHRRDAVAHWGAAVAHEKRTVAH